MLKIVLRIYILGVFIVSGYVSLTYDKHRLVTLNPFDIGVKWPIYAYKNIFKSKLDGNTPEKFIKSANAIIESRDEPYEQVAFIAAIYQIIIHDYVESQLELTQEEIDYLLLPPVTDMIRREYFISNAKNKREKMDSIDLANQIVRMKDYPRRLSLTNIYSSELMSIDDYTMSRIAKQLDGLDYEELMLKGRESLEETIQIRANRIPR